LDGRQVGPRAPSEVRDMLIAGIATPETLVWRTGMAAWTRLGDIPELQAEPGTTPPPLPA